jgi:hypothetical protein
MCFVMTSSVTLPLVAGSVRVLDATISVRFFVQGAATGGGRNVRGRIDSEGRKSVEPMARPQCRATTRSFITSLRRNVRPRDGREAHLIIDDTGLVKKGTESMYIQRIGHAADWADRQLPGACVVDVRT